MKYIKVAGASVNQTPMDWEGNTARLINAIREARRQGATILCLPELAIPAYGCEDALFSTYMIDYSLQCLEEIAAECEDIVVTVGLPLEFESSLYNVVALIQEKQVLGFVAKQELAGDGVYYEPRWFKRWPEGLKAEYRWNGKIYPLGDLVFEIDGVRLGFEICEDAWNGVRPAQDHYLHNVDIILNPSASHFAFGKTQTREKLVTETSRSYFCAYIYSNLVGNLAGRLIFDGEILIASGGKLLARNDRFTFQDYQVITTTLDVTTLRRMKKKSFNFEPVLPPNLIHGVAPLREDTETRFFEREYVPPTYLTKEEEFHQAVTLGLWDYMRKSYSKGFVVSLSGGADSSCCAVLIRETLNQVLKLLGKEGMQEKAPWFDYTLPLEAQFLACVYQGTENSGEETLTSARELAQSLGAEWQHWNVQPFYDGYVDMMEKGLKRELTWETDDIALQNIQARLRAPGIWMLTNIRKALLVTTSNRSEAAVGYATMDGDTAGGIMPLGGIDKAFLRQWLVYAEEHLGYEALKYVNNLKPTAELRPEEYDQTDEGDLMPYPILDKIEEAAIRDYKSPVEVFKTLRGIVPDPVLKGYIRKFFRLWSINQWKRERYAPSFHLDDKNLDPKTWCRFPILSGGFKKGLADLEKYQ